MKFRVLCAFFAALLLIGAVILCQRWLGRVTRSLGEDLAQTEAAFSSGDAESGRERMLRFSEDFSRRRALLSVFVSDARIHEIDRALSRAERLEQAGDTVLVLEELGEISETLGGLSSALRPTLENIL